MKFIILGLAAAIRIREEHLESYEFGFAVDDSGELFDNGEHIMMAGNWRHGAYNDVKMDNRDTHVLSLWAKDDHGGHKIAAVIVNGHPSAAEEWMCTSTQPTDDW